MTQFWKLSAIAAASAGAFAIASPSMAQEPDMWSGWYVGGNLGANWGDSSIGRHVAAGSGAIVIPPADVALINSTGHTSSNKTGFTGGIEGGYNYRMDNWLFGIETDFDALDVNQRSTNTFRSPLLINPPIDYSLSSRAKTSWMWTLRPRVGYVSGPWLVYGTGGIATSEIKVDMNLSDNRIPQNVVNTSDSSTRTGWVAGLGAAYAFAPNWSAKGEWLYADFGTIRTTASSPNGFVNLTSEAQVRSNILRIGVDYRF